MDPFGGLSAVRRVDVDLITDAYRISGTVQTRFGRVTDILNQLTGTHLTVESAKITEHADPSGTLAAPSASVDLASILLMTALELAGGASSEMRIPKLSLIHI